MIMAEQPLRVLVLGGGGFLGSAIMRAAAKAGLAPAAGVRRTVQAGLPGCSTRLCDATDAPSVRRACRDADVVVNAVLGRGDTMLSATANICSAAQESGLWRVLHISSMSVYGDISGTIAEDAPLAADGDRYAAAKIACEDIVQRFISRGGDAVILRPGIVYGPASRQWTMRIARLLASRRLGDIGVAGDGFANLAYIDDVAEAVTRAMIAGLASGTAINIGSATTTTWNEYFVALARALGAVPVPVPRVTQRRLRLETRVLAAPLQALRRIGLDVPDAIPPALLALFGRRLLLDHTRCDTLLGTMRTTEKAGIEASVAWLRKPPALRNGEAPSPSQDTAATLARAA